MRPQGLLWHFYHLLHQHSEDNHARLLEFLEYESRCVCGSACVLMSCKQRAGGLSQPPRPAPHSLNPPAPHPPTTRTALALSQRLIPNQGLKEVTEILSFWPYCAGFPPVFCCTLEKVSAYTHTAPGWQRETDGRDSPPGCTLNKK